MEGAMRGDGEQLAGWVARRRMVSARRRALARPLLAFVLALALLLTAPAAGADRRNDERDAMVRHRLELAMELDELAATDSELLAAIGTLEVWIVNQTAEVEHTQTVLAEATLAARAAEEAEEAKEVEVAELEELMAEMAVAAYVQPPIADELATMQSAAAPGEAARLNVYLDVKAERDTDLVQRLRTAREALTRLRERQQDAEVKADEAHERSRATLAELEAARDRLAELHQQVEVRSNGATHESNLLALGLAHDSDRLTAEASARRTSGLPVVSVRGIRVHSSIAGQVEMMLAAAEADGIRLGGGGYRTNAEQIELRRRHCGDDPYAIFEMPASECSPPTARPGNSLHEVGLAIDFTHNGSIISSRNSPAFHWLAENAHLYGFHNLPSEPWHWSVNGS